MGPNASSTRPSRYRTASTHARRRISSLAEPPAAPSPTGSAGTRSSSACKHRASRCCSCAAPIPSSNARTCSGSRSKSRRRSPPTTPNSSGSPSGTARSFSSATVSTKRIWPTISRPSGTSSTSTRRARSRLACWNSSPRVRVPRCRPVTAIPSCRSSSSPQTPAVMAISSSRPTSSARPPSSTTGRSTTRTSGHSSRPRSRTMPTSPTRTSTASWGSRKPNETPTCMASGPRSPDSSSASGTPRSTRRAATGWNSRRGWNEKGGWIGATTPTRSTSSWPHSMRSGGHGSTAKSRDTARPPERSPSRSPPPVPRADSTASSSGAIPRCGSRARSRACRSPSRSTTGWPNSAVRSHSFRRTRTA